MARKRKNAHRNHDQTQYDARRAMDTYTPELPGDVIHQVLSLLSTKRAARAGILSKEWGHLWSSVPVIDIDEDEDGQPSVDNCKLKRKKFINFMTRCLKRRGKDKSNIDRFRLRMRYYGGVTIVNKLLSFAVERNIKELEISFITEKVSGVVRSSFRPFYLPQPILNNAKSLTTLKLENVNMNVNVNVNGKDTLAPINLPFLKTMSLKLVQFKSQLFFEFNNVISGCPSLEHLSLTSCSGVLVLKVSSSSLKSLEVVNCDVSSIQGEAVNLESLKFRSLFKLDIIPNFSCQRVRSIELYDTFLGKDWCTGFNSSYPLLESLVLHQCHWDYLQGSLKISSQNLKRFVFSESDPIKPFTMKFPNLLEARIELRPYRPVDPWHFYHLRSCQLENFDCSRKVILQVSLPELCTFPEVIRKTFPPPLPSLKHLEVETSIRTTALMDFLHWMAPVSQITFA